MSAVPVSGASPANSMKPACMCLVRRNEGSGQCQELVSPEKHGRGCQHSSINWHKCNQLLLQHWHHSLPALVLPAAGRLHNPSQCVCHTLPTSFVQTVLMLILYYLCEAPKSAAVWNPEERGSQDMRVTLYLRCSLFMANVH